MSMLGKVKRSVEDSLRSFRTLQILIAGVCIAIPLILRSFDNDQFYPKKIELENLFIPNDTIYQWEIDSITNLSENRSRFRLGVVKNVLKIQIDSASRIEKDCFGFRYSVSHYAYSSNSYLFGVLYCMAAMMFIFNGVVYLNKRHKLCLNNTVHWLNILTGISLLGVALSPLYDFWPTHVFFTVAFFALNIAIIGFFPNKKETPKILMARRGMAAFLVLILLLSIKAKLVLWGEWFALTGIALYLIFVVFTVEEEKNINKNEVT